LEQFAENRLLAVLPEKERQKIVRLKQKPSQSEVSMAELDLRDWEDTIGESDSQLRKSATSGVSARPSSKELFDENSKPSTNTKPAAGGRTLPPVRGTKASTSAPAAGAKPTQTIASSAPKVTEVGKQTAEAAPAKRISGYDFRAWERFDADEAAERLEREESQLQEAETQRGKEEIERRRKAKEDEDRRRRLTHQQEMERVLESLRASEMTELQIKTRAGKYL
jgi:small-conductance mechanosensitive channel